MNKILIALFCAGLFAFVAVPSVTADETRPDCEEDQPVIGYNDRNTMVFEEINGNQQLGRLHVCEGEHWDGQDPVDRQSYGGTGSAVCRETVSDESDDHIHVSNCQTWESEEDESDYISGRAVTFRISALMNDTNEEAYIGLNIGPLGQAIVYFGHCEEGGYLEHGTSDEERADEDFELPPQCEEEVYRTGVYVEDNTEGNVLAQVVSAARVTRGVAADGDCTQEEYQHGAYSDDEDDWCERDNTAITAEFYPTLP